MELTPWTVSGFESSFLGGQSVSQGFGGREGLTPLKRLHRVHEAENIRQSRAMGLEIQANVVFYVLLCGVPSACSRSSQIQYYTYKYLAQPSPVHNVICQAR